MIAGDMRGSESTAHLACDQVVAPWKKPHTAARLIFHQRRPSRSLLAATTPFRLLVQSTPDLVWPWFILIIVSCHVIPSAAGKPLHLLYRLRRL